MRTCRSLRDAVLAASTGARLSLSKDEKAADMAAHQALLRRVCTAALRGLQLELKASVDRRPSSNKSCLLEKLLKPFKAEGLPNVHALVLRVS
jgi:hypothetical protein